MNPTFQRMNAAGNVFYLSTDLDADHGSDFARRLGEDCDGLILGRLSPPTMRMFNPDGREAMCGNGLRCLARLLADSGCLKSGDRIETLDGSKRVHLEGDFVEAEMGFARELAGFGAAPGEPSELRLGDETFRGYAVFVGNPHWVLPSDERLFQRVGELGPLFETHDRFPEGVNTEFVLLDSEETRVRVWERGAGETLSCGTGALAVASAGSDPIRAGEARSIRYPGGLLHVRADRQGLLHLGGEIRREGRFIWREGRGLIETEREKTNDPTG